MNKMYPKLCNLLLAPKKSRPVWLALAVAQGLGSTVDDIKSTAKLFSLISGLFLSAALLLFAAPPAALVVDLKNPDPLDHWKQTCGGFYFFCIFCYFSAITLDGLIIGTINTAPRLVDKFSILIYISKFPFMAFTIFNIGNVSGSMALGIAAYFSYGSIGIAVATCTSILAIAVVVVILGLVIGHHGVIDMGSCIDLAPALERYKKLAEIDKNTKWLTAEDVIQTIPTIQTVQTDWTNF